MPATLKLARTHAEDNGQWRFRPPCERPPGGPLKSSRQTIGKVGIFKKKPENPGPSVKVIEGPGVVGKPGRIATEIIFERTELTRIHQPPQVAAARRIGPQIKDHIAPPGRKIKPLGPGGKRLIKPDRQAGVQSPLSPGVPGFVGSQAKRVVATNVKEV